MKKPSGEFFAELGQYVYAYIVGGEYKYIGKGNGDRCWSHVESKGLDPEDCYIVARNLEAFEDKQDWQSFLLESFLIQQHQPEFNSVSGHYKENFKMASLKGLFNTYTSNQRNMHMEHGDFLRKYEEDLGDTIGYTETRGGQFTLETSAIENTYFRIKVSAKTPEFMCEIASNGDQDHFNKLKADVEAAIGEEYDLTSTKGKAIAWFVEDADTAVRFWTEFNSPE